MPKVIPVIESTITRGDGKSETSILRGVQQYHTLDGALLAESDPCPDGGRADFLAAQIDKLATFIMRHIPGEPSMNEGAVDTAIRLLEPLARRQ
jgi:hypothetical protein